jgi:hypothetical protein
LTDDDLTYTEGKDGELIGKLQKRLGRVPQSGRSVADRCGIERGAFLCRAIVGQTTGSYGAFWVRFCRWKMQTVHTDSRWNS